MQAAAALAADSAARHGMVKLYQSDPAPRAMATPNATRLTPPNAAPKIRSRALRGRAMGGFRCRIVNKNARPAESRNANITKIHAPARTMASEGGSTGIRKLVACGDAIADTWQFTMPAIREEKEERELADLAPYALKSRETRGRRVVEEDDPFRTCYERDRDRVTHCAAFRRLEWKTQVIVMPESDHPRTRLTHTLEVVQVARSIGTALRLNEAFVEALALAHDLGHPPFGHAGEETLNLKMSSSGGFAHNRQSLRVVDVLEKRHPGYDGLNLSYELRESLLKHEGNEAAAASGFEYFRHPYLEAQAVDLADSIAYDHHDLDDGLREGMFTENDLEKLALWQRARADAERETPGITGRMRVRRTMNALIGILIGDLTLTSAARLKAAAFRSAGDARNSAQPMIGHSSWIIAEKAELEDFLFRAFYRHYKINRITTKAKRMLAELFDAFLANPALMPTDHRQRCDIDGAPRAICDYLAGMTDRFAIEEHRSVIG